MLLSIKHKKSTVYFLAWSLVVAGVLQSATRPSDAAHGVTSTQLTPMAKESVDEATKARVSEAYNHLPMSFEENHGQVDKQVKYLSRGAASTLFLTQTEAVLTLQASSMSMVRMKLHGANRSPSITGEQELSARTNYFIGNDPQKWHGDVAQYERVRYSEVYPGIDLLYYGQQQSLEYDFEVAPGADPRRITLGFKGVRGLKIDSATGDLLLKTASGEIRQGKPVVYQEADGERRAVKGRYVLKGKRKVGFKLGAYDKTKQLVIDPVLTYSTFLGSGTESGNGIAVDAAGNAYVIGSTNSNSFPVLNQYQTAQGSSDVFVTKFNTNLSGAASLIYSTYLGGSGSDGGKGIAVDSTGNAYVTGTTGSTNFPILNQYQTYQGGLLAGDAFVTKLNTNLSGTASLLYSTYLGGSNDDFGTAIAIDSTGNAYVTGRTSSLNFPTLNACQPNPGSVLDVFVTKLDPNLSGAASLLYSTYLGGTTDDQGYDIAVDSTGNAYVTGSTLSTDFPIHNQYQTVQPGVNGFVTRINTNLSGAASLIYSTYLGGSSTDLGNSIAADGAGNAYVAGYTNSNNFPLLNQYQTFQGEDAFVTKLNTNLSGTASLVYSTYLGGIGDDVGYGIAVDSAGIVYVTGYANSNNFPILHPYQTFLGGYDAFVAKLNPNLSGAASLLYSTYLGGSSTEIGYGIAVDSAGNVYVTGYTFSANFPILHPYQTYQAGQMAFVTKLTTPAVTHVLGDFDLDGKTDLAVWHPSNGDWQYLRSTDGVLITQHWGASGDRPVPRYYDQDDKTDLAVYRPSVGNWYIFQSVNSTVRTVRWGASTDLPVAADYDGDGKADVALYRPSEGVWYIIQSSTNNALAIRWGISEDKPVPADYDGDGKADLAVYRPSESNWYILQSSNNSSRALQWGVSGDKPVIGDYDGDQRADVAVFRPSTGTWYALRSSDGSLFAVQWGVPGDMPVPGDYDADGKTDTAVWRPSTGTWYIVKSSDGLIVEQQFGASGDVPVPATYLPE